MKKFNPKKHRETLGMFLQEMADYMEWSKRKQQMIESGESELSKAEIEWMKKAENPRKPPKK